MTADLHHLAAAYALDALDADERRAFEKHYESCDICLAEVNEFREVASDLAATTATTPPASLKSSVLAEIGQTRQLSPLPAANVTPLHRVPRTMVMAAAAALILLCGILVVTLPNNGDDRTTEFAAATDAVVTSLDSLTSDDASVQIVWSDELDQVQVVGSSLDDPGPNMAYALWFIVGEQVTPAGLFVPDDGSVSEILDVDDLDPNGWGITIEPATGSDQPTTPIIFAAEV